MVKKNTLDEIKESLDNGISFILEAGAGSGKTWSLVESIKYLLETKGKYLQTTNKKIACITYTNVAANEIKSRIDNNPLVHVSTIHSFLWSQIGGYSEDVKKIMIEVNEKKPYDKKIDDLAESLKKVTKLEYNLFKRDYPEGILWHDDVIELSLKVFEEYKKLTKITVSKYPYLFIDEYQDTFPNIVNLLLDIIYSHHKDKIVIGFYGDSMQNIYDSGIGNINLEQYPDIRKITKFENFRCSKRVIELLKYIRPNLEQFPAGKNKEGEISFYFNNTNRSFESVKQNLEKKGWNFSDHKNTKILYLTHATIANDAGYNNLLMAFPYRESLFDRSHFLSNLFFQIEDICYNYKKENYGILFEQLKQNGFRIQKHKDKHKLKKYIDELNSYRENRTIIEVIDFVVNNEIQLIQKQDYVDFCKRISNKNNSLQEEDERDKRIYDLLKTIKFEEVTKLYSFTEHYTAYSTKHGVKGAEFENVLAIIDDNAWRNFNDNQVFSGDDKSNSRRYNRSKNLLYVCCSRAKNKLALYSVTPLSEASKQTIKQWFGEENIIE